MKNCFRVVLTVPVLASLLAAADADLILHGGKVVTVDSSFSVAQAVAIKAGKIAAVGSDREILSAERGPRTQLLNLNGRTVLPGLMDSHVHAYGAGLSEFRAPLARIGSIAGLQAQIREQARKTPRGQWIIVPLPFPTRLTEDRMPTRETLDVVTSHPVLLDHAFITVVNSAGLKLSGIDRNTPDPTGGSIVRDEKGEPIGILRNARSLLKGLPAGSRAQYSMEGLTEEQQLQALEKMLRMYVAAGLTSIKDRDATPEEEIPLYYKLKQRGRLPLRVVLTWRINPNRPLETLLREIESAPYKPHSGDGWLKFDTFKVILDGGMLLGTAYQKFPPGPFAKQLYGQTNPDDRGRPFVAPEKLLSVFRAARDRGWQLGAHVQGGAAIDLLVDTFERLDRERPLAATRSHVIHASFQGPESIAKMARIGVLADAQPAWLYCDSAALQKVFGYDAMRYFFPLRSYLDAGIKVAAGSDHMTGFDKNRATNPYNPFLGMWASVMRKNARGQVFHPEERITREEALKMYTIWGAYMEFAEDSKGSVEKGKLADLVIIDRDYLTCPEDEIRSIEPVMTILDGKIVYRRPSNRAL